MAALEVFWNPFDPLDPGPLIVVVISATDDTIEAGLELGWEFPEPQPIKALLDTGSPFTIVSRTFARNRKLLQTNAGVPIKTLGGRYSCDEHSCSISFPESDLPRIETMRIVASDFIREPHHACLIGRDILRNWDIRLDGRRRRATITA